MTCAEYKKNNNAFLLVNLSDTHVSDKFIAIDCTNAVTNIALPCSTFFGLS